MITLIFLSLGILLIVLQTTVLQLLPFWLGKPDIVFFLVVYIACQSDMLLGALVVLVLGLMMDAFSGVFLGLYPVTYLLVFAFIKGLSQRISINEPVYQLTLAVFSYLFISAGMYVLSLVLVSDSPPQWSWGIILLQLFIIAVIGAPVFVVFEAIKNYYLSIAATGYIWGTKRTNRFK